MSKPVTIFFEWDAADYGVPWWKNFGTFKAGFSDGYFRRVWCFCFAIAFVRMSLHDYNRYLKSGGASEWRAQ